MSDEETSNYWQMFYPGVKILHNGIYWLFFGGGGGGRCEEGVNVQYIFGGTNYYLIE